MTEPRCDPAPAPVRALSLPAALALTVAVFASSVYANLSFAVTNPADYRFFPPFRAGVNVNANMHLGGEYFNMGRSLVQGEGFANPFDEPTGPSAWQPPILPAILGALYWICDGSREAVMAVVVFFQVYVFLVTGLLVMLLTRRTTQCLGSAVAAVVFFLGLVCNFYLCFQFTHDCWLVLLALDLLLAGLCWYRPFASGKSAAAWGLFGGLCALINPIVGFAWGLFSLGLAWRERAWFRFGIMALFAGLALAPWSIRNYLIFGRWIPTKSNLAYELYQSQCLQAEGLLNGATFSMHPYHSATRERREYNRLGEIAYLDKKSAEFWQSVAADPLDFVERICSRLLGATLWYVPFYRDHEARWPWVTFFSRVIHPLPFLGMLILLITGVWQPLQPSHWAVIGLYLLYLLPYIAASYYERYAVPLIGVKVLLVIWGADRLLTLAWREPANVEEEGVICVAAE